MCVKKPAAVEQKASGKFVLTAEMPLPLHRRKTKSQNNRSAKIRLTGAGQRPYFRITLRITILKKERVTKMKKMFLTIAMALTMTAAFAEGDNENSVNNLNAYNMRVNMTMLSKALHLNSDQRETVEFVHEMFSHDMMNAATAATKEERDQKVKRAVNRDLANMRYILNDEQYHQYVRILNITFNNRGLK